MKAKKQPNRREQRPQRRINIQQIIFAIFGILIILSMIIGSLVSF
jgi:hypothetical protein